ncbi:Ribonuclease 3 (Ribonuclease III) [Mycoplasmoides gallisepticum CA06_2006.052-5-2P]|uniref:Ribonuclease 3 n=1 Tax=Mycoplasmoides gallisepticum WI01_2001.043-13-2P TaxID=1159201 RepID=J3YH93_MYCGL|nr:ribonuclease III [Mycoplasmoides gallisepticum]AFP76058.1 Ribonuclease 3 (Ribonuclease III) [Mycoplasmoides gallisepticum VA94_7994-1-7P]AFP76825.1 Ribonuclease 3 (Ribonuclease III) [Mycoplasmoides gallisepticum NC95_13295-2-2P]AFP77579.1 Ribonuclease 3 (Ribonuclease III) [Mycoplasmoides gallisepticum NC96_1596-4-2P]AFP78350.1 Ribonuclease 3 (Ribonuclease III) [Mycoplasmoides gallisepticum NY01_2001.047-5-1P]AFP79110.1 Ribonuclease 3 (Ribonuclease III) [Mycoplasmoides gallisepticum WI01_200
MENLEKNTKKKIKKPNNFKKNNKDKTEELKDKPTPRMFKMTPKSSKFLHQLGVTGRKHTEKPVPLNDPDYEKKIREIQAKEAKKIRSDEVVNNNSKKQNNNKQAKKKANKNKKQKGNNNNFQNNKKPENWKQKPAANNQVKAIPNSEKSTAKTAINLIIKRTFETLKQNNLIAPNLKQNPNKKDKPQQPNVAAKNNNQKEVKKSYNNFVNNQKNHNKNNAGNKGDNKQPTKPLNQSKLSKSTIVELPFAPNFTSNQPKPTQKEDPKKVKSKKAENSEPQESNKQVKKLEVKTNQQKQDQTKKKQPQENKNQQIKAVNLGNNQQKTNNNNQKNSVDKSKNDNNKKKPEANQKQESLNPNNNNKKKEDSKNESNNIPLINKNISDQQIVKISNYIKDNYPVIYADLKEKNRLGFNSNLDDDKLIVYANYEAKDLELLLKKFKVVTNNIGLYEEALTHNSYANEMHLKYNYQRLEFLGDAIINKIVAEYLFNHSDSSEGEMTKDRIKIIQSNTLIKAATQLELINYIRVGEGLKIAPLSPKILEDIFEAFIGAMYLDQGEYAVRKILNDTIIGYYQKGQLTENTDYKSIFQEIIHSTGLNMKIHYERTYDRQKNLHTVSLYAGGIMYGEGKDSNTHKAEIKAAKEAISKFRGLLKLEK